MQLQPLAFLDFMINLYDPHGDLHAINTSTWSGMLANAYGLIPADIQNIELAARFHDIGKAAIPESIRRYPGVYTPLEHYTMQRHSQIGAQMLQLLDFHPNVIAIVLAHHENFDGSGYPTALRREMIPIGARIIRIVDSFDALTHSRGYRQACSNAKAIHKLHDLKHHYDPDLLQLFTDLVSTWTQQVT